MSYRDDEKRWKRIQEMLAAEASGKTVRAGVSQRTLFGIPSTMEQTIERVVAEDEEARRMKQRVSILSHVEHTIDPVYDERSRVLVLGSIPSPASREVGFYYGHHQNRFWRVIAELFDEPLATTTERKRDQLLRHHIALWDVIASCDIAGASDASILNAQPNDLRRIIEAAPIEAVFCTGNAAAETYQRLCQADIGMPCTKLPSTSAANAAMRLPALVEAYRALLPHLHEAEPPMLDVADVVALEQAIAAGGTSLAELMDRAGTALAYRVHRENPRARIVVFCGNGNNGGDGWVAARELAAMGHRVTLVSAKQAAELKAQPAHDAACCAEAALRSRDARILVAPTEASIDAALADADVIIDAILGTGFAGTSVKEPFETWIRKANDHRGKNVHVVACDVPSGMNAQTGAMTNPCVIANETLTMIASKPGLAKLGNGLITGKVRVAPLAYIEPYR